MSLFVEESFLISIPQRIIDQKQTNGFENLIRIVKLNLIPI